MQNTEQKHALGWFEIPVTDMERAQKFYSHVLDAELKTEDWYGVVMSVLPFQNGVGGSLMESKEHGYTPSQEGSIIYLNATPDLAPYLARVEEVGGQTLTPKTSIGSNGFIALFLDSEGNKVGLYSLS